MSRSASGPGGGPGGVVVHASVPVGQGIAASLVRRGPEDLPGDCGKNGIVSWFSDRGARRCLVLQPEGVCALRKKDPQN